jgi:hypothetical protein
MAVMVAKGGRFGDAKASKALAEILVVLFPLNKVELKQRHTSGIIKCPAMSRESSMFSRASFFRSEKGTWDPGNRFVNQGGNCLDLVVPTGKDDWFPQTLKHKTQGRTGVS